MIKKNQTVRQTMPDLAQVKAELQRRTNREKTYKTLRETLATLIVVAACAVLISMLWVPVMHIYGSSMTPTLAEGDVVVALRTSRLKPGDIAAFYVGNKLLIKRCVAGPGAVVDIDGKGTLYVDGKPQEEAYLTEKALGECDITFPFQVPQDRWFVLGDRRATSVDSRSSIIGCVSEEQLTGKVVFRIWPLSRFGGV